MHAVSSLVPRAAVALIALLIVAWAAVLWHNQRIGDDASDRLLANPRMAEADFQRVLDDYRRAESLDPGTDWRLTRAGALVLRDQPRRGGQADGDGARQGALEPARLARAARGDEGQRPAPSRAGRRGDQAAEPAGARSVADRRLARRLSRSAMTRPASASALTSLPAVQLAGSYRSETVCSPGPSRTPRST